MLFFAGTWIQDWLGLGNYKTSYNFRFIVHIEVALHCYLLQKEILKFSTNLLKHINRVEHQQQSINISCNIKAEV